MEFGKIENIVEAKFRIVTPMFLGGADKQADEIRPASVKGVLRFWWRALNWSRIRKSKPNDVEALKAMHAAEAKLFGSAAGDDKGGQGIFLLGLKEREESSYIWKKIEPQVSYLLGLGLYNYKMGVTRSSIQGGFKVALRFRESAGQDDRASVIEALMVTGLLGGMGSRQRRGFGSLAMEGITGVGQFQTPKNMQDYSALLNNLFINDLSALPPFTAFSAMSKYVILSKPTVLETLEALGDEMGMYRGWGRNGKVFNKPAKPQFKSDHDNMYAAANGKNYPDESLKRLVFGMPHNYQFSSGGRASIQNTRSGLQRRASPLFMHVHQCDQEGKGLGIMFMLPAKFLPDNDQVIIKGIASKKVAPNVDWKVLEHLLNRPAFNQDK